MIYFDNAASTPLHPEVSQYMYGIMQNVYGNPSSAHKAGREARVLVDEARENIANLLNAEPGEIIFTSGGTEACNTALWGAAQSGIVKSIITSKLEHPAVLKTLGIITNHFKIPIHFTTIDILGHTNLNHLENLLQANPNALVCLMHANNEIGNLLPVKNVKDLCIKYHGTFFSDTVQTMGKFYIDMMKNGFDIATCSAHKFHGPKGVGFLYLRKGLLIKPFIYGGGQERNMRAGTENVHAIAGMSKALTLAYLDMQSDIAYIESLKQAFASGLKTIEPNVKFNGDCETSGLHSILSVSFPKGDNTNMLAISLDIEGIAVSAGSACSSGVVHASHVISELYADLNNPVIRFSFSKFNTLEEVNQCLLTIKKLLT